MPLNCRRPFSKDFSLADFDLLDYQTNGLMEVFAVRNDGKHYLISIGDFGSKYFATITQVDASCLLSI